MYAVPASTCDASTVGIHAFGASPTMFFTTFVHDFPPSRVTWTLPSSVPIQITFESRGDGAIESSVVWNSAAVLSVTISPPDDRCLVLSFVVRSGEITVHELPWFVLLKSTFPPKYTTAGF